MKKKLISLLMISTMAVSLVACGSGATDSAETSETTETTDESTDSAATADGKVYNVGVIQLVQHDALDAATEGFTDALSEKLGDSITITIENASNDIPTCSTIANQFASEGVDLIMANATPSLQSATAATDSIPIVATSVTDYGTALSIDDWTGSTGINVTGTADLAPLDGQAEMLNELFPDAKTVGILYCSAEANSEYQATTITGYLESYGYTVETFTFSDSNDVAQVTQSACDASDVIYVPTDNTAASCTESINNVALSAGVPIVAGEEGICSGCGVATLSISYYDIGYAAGLMAYDILVNGTDPSTMEIQYASNFTKEYNADICEKLGITVPDDYVAIATE